MKKVVTVEASKRFLSTSCPFLKGKLSSPQGLLQQKVTLQLGIKFNVGFHHSTLTKTSYSYSELCYQPKKVKRPHPLLRLSLSSLLMTLLTVNINCHHI